MGINSLVDSPKWFWTFVFLAVASVLGYCAAVIYAEVSPGNLWGLTFGTIASLLMLVAALYGLRRRLMSFSSRLGLGKARTWLQFHIYGGALFLLFMFMHTGFVLPSGPLNWLLYGFSIWVTISGLFGVFLQKWIPRILASGLSVEVIYERIPELVAEMRFEADKLVETCTQPVKDFYLQKVVLALAAPKTRLIYYLDITGGIQSEFRQFAYLGKVLSEKDSESLQQLEAIYKTKLELDAHYTLQKALRIWLYAHVPTSLFLLVLVALHLFVVRYY